MKKNELKYLLNLHARIGRGCEILKVTRDAFLPALTQCLDLVSLGMEMGVRMKGKGKSEKTEAKPTTKAKPSARRGNEKRKAQVALLREKAIKRLSKGPVQFHVLVKDLTKYVGDVTRPEQAIWSFLRGCPEIQQLSKRGPYSLRPKRKGAAKAKKASNGKTTKKAASNGKTTAVATPALVH